MISRPNQQSHLFILMEY